MALNNPNEGVVGLQNAVINIAALRGAEKKRLQEYNKANKGKMFDLKGKTIEGLEAINAFKGLVNENRFQSLISGNALADGSKHNKFVRDANFKKMRRDARKSGKVSGSPELLQRRQEMFAQPNPAPQMQIQALLQQLGQQQQMQPQFQQPAFQPQQGAGIFGLANQPSKLANFSGGQGFSQINNPTILKAKGGK